MMHVIPSCVAVSRAGRHALLASLGLFAVLPQAGAQSSVGACHMQVEGGALFRSKVMRIRMDIAGDPKGLHNDCTLDLKTLSSAGASVQGRGSVPIQIAKADLRTAPKDGAVDREDDVLINYRAKTGFRGTDRFTVVLTGQHAENRGSTTLDVTVAVR